MGLSEYGGYLQMALSTGKMMIQRQHVAAFSQTIPNINFIPDNHARYTLHIHLFIIIIIYIYI